MKLTPPHNQTSRTGTQRLLKSFVGLIAALCGTINHSTGATVSIGVQHWELTSPELNPANNADLVNAGSPDLLFFNSTSFTTPLGIFDGSYENKSLITEDEDQYPALITFSLDVVSNPLGYNITSIRSLSLASTGLTGVDDSRMQYYKVEYSVVGDTGFETLLTVDIRDFEPEGFDWNEGWTWVTLLDIEDELTGVDVLRFTWLDPSATDNDSGSWIGEIDILGSPVTQIPEPGSTVLLLGATALFLRRTRSR